MMSDCVQDWNSDSPSSCLENEAAANDNLTKVKYAHHSFFQFLILSYNQFPFQRLIYLYLTMDLLTVSLFTDSQQT